MHKPWVGAVSFCTSQVLRIVLTDSELVLESEGCKRECGFALSLKANRNTQRSSAKVKIFKMPWYGAAPDLELNLQKFLKA